MKNILLLSVLLTAIQSQAYLTCKTKEVTQFESPNYRIDIHKGQQLRPDLSTALLTIGDDIDLVKLSCQSKYRNIEGYPTTIYLCENSHHQVIIYVTEAEEKIHGNLYSPESDLNIDETDMECSR